AIARIAAASSAGFEGAGVFGFACIAAAGVLFGWVWPLAAAAVAKNSVAIKKYLKVALNSISPIRYIPD
ncbi:hypothetical protein WAJ64_21365, partial [Acinetobacter baumannii]